MNKCVKITVYRDCTDKIVQNFIYDLACKLKIEGVAQPATESIKIVACGKKEGIDNFIDSLNRESNINNIEIEPSMRDKDYRGVFRIINL